MVHQETVEPEASFRKRGSKVKLLPYKYRILQSLHQIVRVKIPR